MQINIPHFTSIGIDYYNMAFQMPIITCFKVGGCSGCWNRRSSPFFSTPTATLLSPIVPAGLPKSSWELPILDVYMDYTPTCSKVGN